MALYIVRGDEELARYKFKSRTHPDNNWKGTRFTPSVVRFYPVMREYAGDFRVDISPLQQHFFRINNIDSMDDGAAHYHFAPGRAMFNNTGYPRQAYLVMQGNYVSGEQVNNLWLKFETVKPTDNVSDLTPETHPHLIHHWDQVGIVRRTVTTIKRGRTVKRDQWVTTHTIVTPHGRVYYFLATREGHAYIPLLNVRRIT